LPYHAVHLQQSLPRKLDLARRLALLEAALGNTHAATLNELDLVLVSVPGAGAVVGEVDAGEGVGAEVVVAGGCSEDLSVVVPNKQYIKK
jgi:hypothetical protein